MKKTNSMGNYNNMQALSKDYVRRKWLPILSSGGTVSFNEIFYDLDINMIPYSELNIKKFLRRMSEQEGFDYNDVREQIEGAELDGGS